MGSVVCDAVAVADDLELAAAIGRGAAGTSTNGVTISRDLEVLTGNGCEVVVELTRADAAREHASWLAAHGLHAVIGTSGLTDDDIADLAKLFTASNCIVAPNFAISAVLMMRFAAMAAPFFDSAEVIEFHHDGKVDAPAGTAIAVAERMAAASDTWAADATQHEPIPGSRGARGPGVIRVHSVRMRGMVAHNEVVLGTTGQSLTIRQDSYDRSSYVPGVLLACRRIADRPGVTVGLDDLLELD